MKKTFFLIFFTTGLAANAQELLSLEEAIALGLENNYAIKIAEKDEEIAGNNNSVGNAGILPTVDLNADKTYQVQNVDLELQSAEGTFGVTRDRAKSDRFNATAALSWTIFDGARMFIAKNRLAELERAGNLQSRLTLENTVAAISDAYYRIVLEQTKLAVLQQTLEISESRVNFARSRYEVGKASKLDYLAAQVDYNTDQSNLLRQEEVLSNAFVDLNVLLAQDVNTKYKVEDSISVNEKLVYDDLEEKIQASNPRLLFAFKNQNIAYLEYKERVAERFPTIDVGASYGYGTSNNEAGQLRSSTTDGLTYGITASWNIFDGFNKNREIQNARVQREISQIQTDEIKQELLANLQRVYVGYNNSLNLVTLEKENVNVALENEQIAIDRYELGAGTSLELREAQRNSVDARTRLFDAILSAKQAEIELLRLSGQILSD